MSLRTESGAARARSRSPTACARSSAAATASAPACAAAASGSRRCAESASRWRAASASPSSARTARASRRWSGSSRRCSCTTAATRNALRPRPVRHPRGAPARQPRLGRGLLLQEDVVDREPLLRGPVLRAHRRPDPRPDPGDPRARRLPGRPAQRGDGGPVARHAAEGRARPRAPDPADPAPARRADDGPRPALEARGPGLHPRDPRDARRDDPALHARPRRGRSARGPHRHPRRRPPALPSSPSTELKRRYGADTLEEAFFAATGKAFEDEKPEEDEK